MSTNEFNYGFSSAFATSDCNSWVSQEEARAWWRDAPADDEYLQMLMDAARDQVLAYGPQAIADNIAATGCVPQNYRMAQLMQTRNIWNAAKTDPAGTIGGEPGFTFTPFPMDWTVKQVIRPKRAKPVLR